MASKFFAHTYTNNRSIKGRIVSLQWPTIHITFSLQYIFFLSKKKKWKKVKLHIQLHIFPDICCIFHWNHTGTYMYTKTVTYKPILYEVELKPCKNKNQEKGSTNLPSLFYLQAHIWKESNIQTIRKTIWQYL